MSPSRGPARSRRRCWWSTKTAASTSHIRDVARRIGLEGFRAVAPDFLSLSGGTPANEDAARDAIGKLDLAKVTADAVTMLDELAKSSRGGKVGAVGFCWGGAFVNRLAVAAGDKLDAGVVLLRPGPRSVGGGQGPGTAADPPRRARHAGGEDRSSRGSPRCAPPASRSPIQL